MKVGIAIVAAVLAGVLPLLSSAPTNAVPTTAPAIQATTEPVSIDQLKAEADQSRIKSELTHKALETVRAAVIQRLSQTPDYRQAEAALAEAQKELASASSAEDRTKAATDRTDAKTRLELLIGSDGEVKGAAQSDAEAIAQLAAALRRLANAKSDIATAAAKATTDAKAKAKADADAAIPPEIKTAMAQHTLAVGMTLEQCNQSIGAKGKVTGADAGETQYEWDQVSRDTRANKVAVAEGIFITPYYGAINNSDGKLVSFTKGEGQLH